MTDNLSTSNKFTSPIIPVHCATPTISRTCLKVSTIFSGLKILLFILNVRSFLEFYMFFAVIILLTGLMLLYKRPYSKLIRKKFMSSYQNSNVKIPNVKNVCKILKSVFVFFSTGSLLCNQVQ